MGNSYDVVFRLVQLNPDIVGDTAGKEPGEFQYILVKVDNDILEITSEEEAYFYVDVEYIIGGKRYSRLSWKVLGPTILATNEGLLYSLADYIYVVNPSIDLKGTIYIHANL